MNVPANSQTLRPFLTAEWRHLAMLNYEIEPAVLKTLVPAGTELDQWNGKTFISVVGFRFLKTRLLGWRVPFHQDFEEVNLRFYVRRLGPEGWRRGVVFVKEIVPRRAVTWVARAVYGENYVTFPMGHNFNCSESATGVYYWWICQKRSCQIELFAEGQAKLPEPGSEEEFITEHYWGYTKKSVSKTIEYRVDHPRWTVCPARAARLNCDGQSLYGEEFGRILQGRPSSAFLAEGSEVTVYRGNKIP